MSGLSIQVGVGQCALNSVASNKLFLFHMSLNQIFVPSQISKNEKKKYISNSE